ncbi:D-alanyl-D-alanine carboxypeptidase family protein [Psychromicrobium sp. YIM B11713]|uniref:M15 family metallopeptidase n=1 Tax=Psychromicrobium sp. YIM B11713 TaxID=3145233 RepID=UPI00374F399C
MNGSAMDRRAILHLGFGGLAALGLAGCAPEPPAASSSGAASSSSSPVKATIGEIPGPAQHPAAALAHSLDDPSSIWVVVNKHRPLRPSTYRPNDLVQPRVTSMVSGESALLRAPAARALEALAQEAAAQGTPLSLVSGFRSYQTQVATYGSYAGSVGVSGADHASARPGYSEHQTGLAVDVGDSGGCNLQPCFADRPLARWVGENSHRFGFVVRYQLGFHLISGYFAEPWHLRFVGVELATAVKKSGLHTLEEYFGLEAAPDYS